jgi:hypothetical protein
MASEGDAISGTVLMTELLEKQQLGTKEMDVNQDTPLAVKLNIPQLVHLFETEFNAPTFIHTAGSGGDQVHT